MSENEVKELAQEHDLIDREGLADRAKIYNAVQSIADNQNVPGSGIGIDSWDMEIDIEGRRYWIDVKRMRPKIATN